MDRLKDKAGELKENKKLYAQKANKVIEKLDNKVTKLKIEKQAKEQALREWNGAMEDMRQQAESKDDKIAELQKQNNQLLWLGRNLVYASNIVKHGMVKFSHQTPQHPQLEQPGGAVTPDCQAQS